MNIVNNHLECIVYRFMLGEGRGCAVFVLLRQDCVLEAIFFYFGYNAVNKPYVKYPRDFG